MVSVLPTVPEPYNIGSGYDKHMIRICKTYNLDYVFSYSRNIVIVCISNISHKNKSIGQTV